MKLLLQNPEFTYGRFLTGLLLMTVMTVSCKKDDIAPSPSGNPVINITELGSGNSGTVEAGKDLHIEGVIEAEGLIDKIEIEIHQEGGSFEIEQIYTEEYAGSRKANFHEHIDIPAEAPAGEYHFHIKVTDKKGQTAEFESDLIVVANAPQIDNVTAGSKETPDDGVGHIGAALYIAADIKSENKISDIKIIVRHTSVAAARLEIDAISFYNEATGILSAKTDIPLNAVDGDYLLTIEVKDEKGNIVKHEQAVDVNSKPFIEGFEAGYGHGDDRDGRYGVIGKDLHMQATVYCLVNRLKSIRIRIVEEVAHNPYVIEVVYDESTGYFGAVGGARNDYFHQHIDIPADAPTGKYKYHFIVHDRKDLKFEKVVNFELKTQ